MNSILSRQPDEWFWLGVMLLVALGVIALGLWGNYRDRRYRR